MNTVERVSLWHLPQQTVPARIGTSVKKLVETGHVDVMVSVGNNFFYTKSLPCSLWFFDKGKPQELQDKVLFIDARNYYTVVDRTLNEWSDWQLKNLNAIVWLYRGETEKYIKLLDNYRRYLLHCAVKLKADDVCHVITPTATFTDILSAFESFENRQKERAKFDMEHILRKDKKRSRNFGTKKFAAITEAITATKEAIWLYEKFGGGEYRDVLGLCKVESRGKIEEKNYSLTPGAYVGVATVETTAWTLPSGWRRFTGNCSPCRQSPMISCKLSLRI